MEKKIDVIQIIDSDRGGGAEKIVSYLKDIKVVKRVIIFSKSNHKDKLGTKYISLDIKTNSFFSIILATWGIFKFLLNIRNRKKIILHSHLGKSLYAAFLPSLIFGIPHIHTEHNTHNRRRSKWYFYFFEYIIYSSLKHVVCISDETKSKLLSHLPSLKKNQISIIENGTALIKYKKRKFQKKKFNLVILGSLTFKKGIDLFIESLPQFVSRVNEVKIIGSGPEKDKLIYLTKKLSLSSKVKFINYTKKIDTFLYNSDIGLIPSRWEGFGLVALEMRSSGLPLLISDTPGLGQIFSKYNGVVKFKSGSKVSLVKSLNKLLDSLNNNQLSIIDVSKDFEKYNLKSFVNRYKNFYEKQFIQNSTS